MFSEAQEAPLYEEEEKEEEESAECAEDDDDDELGQEENDIWSAGDERSTLLLSDLLTSCTLSTPKQSGLALSLVRFSFRFRMFSIPKFNFDNCLFSLLFKLKELIRFESEASICC